MDNATESLTVALREALGPDRVSTAGDDLVSHSRDACPQAAKWSAEEWEEHSPGCVVRPQSAAEVAKILRLATERNIPVVPYGAGSGVVGAAVPLRHAISLDTRRLNRIVEIDTENWLVTAEAGAMGSDVEEAVNRLGFTLGHYPQSLHISTVGGWVATAATGTFSSKYGGIEDILYALEVVLPTGEVMQTRRIARSSAGPRIQNLFIGSEGALGVITQVTLKLHPLPEVRRFRGVMFPDIRQGLAAVRELFRSHLVPAVIRLYEENEAAVLYNAAGAPPGRPLLLLGTEGLASVALAQEQRTLEICARSGGEDAGPEIGNLWEKHRFNAQWLDEGNAGECRMADALDVSADWKTLPVIYDAAMQALASLTNQLWAHYSHFTAHGGSIYFIVFIEGRDRRDTRERYEQVWRTAMQTVQSLGGSVAHHHGAGLLRLPYLEREFGSELPLLRKIKQALDPNRILNPGKLHLDPAEK